MRKPSFILAAVSSLLLAVVLSCADLTEDGSPEVDTSCEGLAICAQDRALTGGALADLFRGLVAESNGVVFVQTGAAIRRYDAETGAFLSQINRTGFDIAPLGQNIVLGGPLNFGYDDRVHVVATDGSTVLTINDPSPGSLGFGASLAVSGNSIFVGDYLAPEPSRTGRIYEFNATTGALVRTINNPTGLSEEFGRQVAVSDNYIFATAPYRSLPGFGNAGALHVFDRSNGAFVRTINSPSPGLNTSYFGQFDLAARSDGRVLVPHPNGSGGPAARVYEFDGPSGALLRTLDAPPPASGDLWGVAVAYVGDDILVGASGVDVSGGAGLDTGAGAVDLYRGSDSTRLFRVFDPNPNPLAPKNANFGGSVAGSPGRMIVAEPGRGNGHVLGTNRPPVGIPQSRAMLFNTSMGITVSATDLNLDPLVIRSVLGPFHGVLTSSASGSFTYTPDAFYSGPDSFSFVANDGCADSTPTAVNINIIAVPPATAVDDFYSPVGDQPFAVAAPGVIENDVQTGSQLFATLVSDVSHGSLVFGSSGDFSYTPDLDYVGPDEFTYTVFANGQTSNVGTVSVDVLDPTPIVDDVAPFSGDENEYVLLPLTWTHPDPADSFIAHVDWGDDIQTESEFPVGARSADIAHVYSAAGVYLVSFWVADQNDHRSTTHTTTITIIPDNRPPTAVADSVGPTPEDTALSVAISALLANDTDPDAGDVLTLESVTQGAFGGVVVSGANVVYTPSANFRGTDHFGYTVRDAEGENSSAVVTVTVSSVNDAPVAVLDSFTTSEDVALGVNVSALLANDNDVDGNTLSVAAVSSPLNGSVSLAGSTVTFTPTAHFKGAASFSYTLSDGTTTVAGNVNIAVLSVNDAPVASPDSVAATEDTLLTIPIATLLANDTDADLPSDAIQLSAVSQGVWGSVSVAGANVLYAPLGNFNGTDQFTYTIVDQSGASSTAVVTVTVSSVNDAPIAAQDADWTLEDVPIDIDAVLLLVNDFDVDGDSLSVVTASQPVNGTVTLAAGIVTFTPDLHFRGTASFQYEVSDGTLVSSGVVTVTVLPVNHAPDAPSLVEPAAGGTSATLTPDLVAQNATDIDLGDTLTLEFEIDSTPAFESPALQSSGALSQDVNGTTTWTVPTSLTEDTAWYWRVRSNDGFATSDWVVGSFFASATNDPPSAPISIGPSGDLLFTRTPTLTALASSDPEGDAVTYEFEVSDDDGAVVTGSTGNAPDATSVSWTVDIELKRGKTFTWRVRGADAGGAAGDWSALSTFEVYKKPADSTGSCSIGELDQRSGPSTALATFFFGLLVVHSRIRRRSDQN